jgi:hypothetical protein
MVKSQVSCPPSSLVLNRIPCTPLNGLHGLCQVDISFNLDTRDLGARIDEAGLKKEHGRCSRAKDRLGVGVVAMKKLNSANCHCSV